MARTRPATQPLNTDEPSQAGTTLTPADVNDPAFGVVRIGAASTPIVEIELPVAAEVHDPIPHHVNVVLLSQESKAGMARLRDGLIAAGVRMPNGRLVESNADAIRVVLESIASS